MKKKSIAVLIMAAIAVLVMVFAYTQGSKLAGTRGICDECYGKDNGACVACSGTGYVLDEESGENVPCENCGGSGLCPTCSGEGYVTGESNYFATWLSLLPPIIAIAFALVTKEVYSSLFLGIFAGALMVANFNIKDAFVVTVQNGFVDSLTGAGHVGILVFLVMLGMVVVMMNRAGGSRAYGEWASKNIKSRKGALLSTFGLGCLIFVDDYFNCLTVGSVMRPVTDKHKISRAKLAYLIDATAAPICMIAPISSWAAAVASYTDSGDSIGAFIRAIPFNFYSLLTIVAVVFMVLLNIDFGSMKKHEANAQQSGDLFSGGSIKAEPEEKGNERGRVIDLILPVVILIICCIGGMLYTGGILDGETVIDAFANCDASIGLALGSVLGVVIDAIYFMCRRVLSFKECMEALPEGFKAMVPAILILTFAWTICSMTGTLGAKFFVGTLINGSAGQMLQPLLPAIVFLIACGLSFATGTSWGTFGILIPIVTSALGTTGIGGVALSACLAGAVCGDHCSPISDTTIMASTGAQCDHINHVSTQLPYALTVAAVSAVSYVIAGFIPNAIIALPIAIVLMIGTLLAIKFLGKKKA